MTNGEKFKTAQERYDAFIAWCDNHGANCNKDTDSGAFKCAKCQFAWLDLEAESEKPLPCPFCGGECELVGIPPCTGAVSIFRVKCEDCSYQSGDGSVVADEAIAAHNRVAKKCRESEVK